MLYCIIYCTGILVTCAATCANIVLCSKCVCRVLGCGCATVIVIGLVVFTPVVLDCVVYCVGYLVTYVATCACSVVHLLFVHVCISKWYSHGVH